MLGGVFSNKTEAKNINTKYKYSILNEINDEFRDNDRKFTFALFYPELKLYNIWQQSNNPLNEPKKWTTNNYYKVQGYRNFTTLADRKHEKCNWGGLVLSHTENLIDGCPGGEDWYFTIGYVGRPWFSVTDKIPSNDSPVNVVSMWVKVINDKYTIIQSCMCKYFNNNHLEYLSFIILFLCE
ncbi:hypothetical protein TVAG_145500 [Trichomonas vaginalis G3]|uniref:Uncharacterized protein n=1 Tax=Trichomonas vaginalis (strain ATCC PRA-98 / G3) TaxID=412133 RepID=A2EFR9_TRIV3|nr:hypothetical protein TVAGG3_0445560 [Trichomonas vaginalis G3]EAY08470.1 hypothetical protein TVAG_145500 [Trichomonas vaginalis G3]KAI5537773.1 hypothetical protein TVAGG3_0445560 [Trichomonas vaginalis G3]|eukprot:XP_001320693.1 hypothetical protein [Trichomonas vaginalis G3]